MGGYTGLGLAGMKEKARIPECHGIAGVSEFVDVTDEDDGGAVREKHDWLGLKIQDRHIFEAQEKERRPHLQVARVGITIHRPLLDFKKLDLVRVCEERGIQWVEDPTNSDRASTVRNTVRYLLSQHQLPKALRAPRLVSLSDKVRSATNSVNEASRSVLNWTEARSFDFGTGVFTYLLPSCWIHRDSENTDEVLPRPPQIHVLRRLFRAFIRLATPLREVSPNAGRAVAEHVGRHSSSFTIADTKWSIIGDERYSGQAWRVYRAPSRQHRSRDISCQWNSMYPARPESSTAPGAWQLWDNRYWIRVSLKRNMTAVCRFLEPDDVSRSKRSMSMAQRRAFSAALGRAGEESIRYSLPALLDEQSNMLLAIPTLQLDAPGCMDALKYDVRYKAIEQEGFPIL